MCTIVGMRYDAIYYDTRDEPGDPSAIAECTSEGDARSAVRRYFECEPGSAAHCSRVQIIVHRDDDPAWLGDDVCVIECNKRGE